ncbi:lysine transporter LysE [Aeromicrobium sp. Root236]|uniref:LysE family translocator n=1 Tax=Aeromicrobium sp. Root236 TaxID=1736498 RepID=UPI0006FF8514|nr:LysE family translocator [Aeromicrobium sp. Root236]KRC64323.1 lysine transporter LysE [Aeromicrobium sp. Root236]
MLSMESALTFAVASFLLIVIPGPSVLFVVGRSLSLGRRGGLLSVAGNELGGLVPIAAVALGIGALVSDSIIAFTIVKIAGGAYVIFLGIQAIRHRRTPIDQPMTAPKSGGRLLWQGFVVGATNPKTIVFFVAVLPQFVDHDRGGIPGQILVLGLIFTVIAFACDSVWAVAAGAARAWFARSPRRMSQMNATGGTMMIGLGGGLLLAGNKA